MKMLNGIGPSVDPWSTLLITGLQLDFMPLITVPWAQPFRQFSIRLAVCSPSPCFRGFSVRILWQTVLKALLKSRQSSRQYPLLSAHLLSQSFLCRLVKRDFFVDPCWLVVISLLFFMCLEMASRIHYCVTFQSVPRSHLRNII